MITRKMKKKRKSRLTRRNAGTAIALVTAATLAAGCAGKQWAEFETFVNPNEGSAVRFVGGMNPTANSNVSLLSNFSGSEEEPFDVQRDYLQVRPLYDLTPLLASGPRWRIGAMGMLEDGSQMEGVQRAGIAGTLKGRRAFVQARIFPWSTNRQFRGDIYHNVRLPHGVEIDGFASYKKGHDNDSKTLFVEEGIGLRRGLHYVGLFGSVSENFNDRDARKAKGFLRYKYKFGATGKKGKK